MVLIANRFYSVFKNKLSFNSTFEGMANFYRISVDGDLRAEKTHFMSVEKQVNFDSIKVGGDFFFYEAEVNGPITFERSDLGGFDCNNTKFNNNAKQFIDNEGNTKPLEVNNTFYNMRVKSDADFTGTTSFAGSTNLERIAIEKNLNLNIKSFQSSYSLQDAEYRTINIGVEYPETLKLIENSKVSGFGDFAKLETSYRNLGLSEAADRVYIDGRFREGSRLNWAKYLGNRILWITVGYGKQPEWALVYSLILIIVGCFFFWREDNMMVLDDKYKKIVGEDKDKKSGNIISEFVEGLLMSLNNLIVRYAFDCNDFRKIPPVSKYNPVWYSIALFLPIVSLEDTKIWTPKTGWGRFYMRVHVVLGFLLIPIGLAAWTGLIK